MCMGNDNNLLYPATAPAIAPNEPGQSYRNARVEAGQQSFNSETRTVTIRNFHATMRNNPYDKINEFSALQISLLRSSSSRQDSINRENDEAYRAHVLLESRVLLNNGRLTIDGLLQKAEVVTRDSAGVQIAEVRMPELRIELPANVPSDSVAVVVGSDVGTLDSGISTRYLPGHESTTYEMAAVATSNEVLEFSSYPNPAARGPVTVDAMVAQPQQVTIGLYNEANMLVLPVYSGALPSRTRRSFPVNLQQIAPGTYYLRLTRSSGSLTRRVIVR